MGTVVLLVAYNRLDIPVPEIRNLFRNGYPVLDGVLALEGGAEMSPGVVYHFADIGSSVIKLPEDDVPETLIRLEGESTFKFADEQKTYYHPDIASVVRQVDELRIGDRSRASLNAASGVAPQVTTTPPDGKEWNMTAIRARGDTADRFKGTGVRIAIIDSGIAEHSDLTVRGRVSFLENDTAPRKDELGHGTRCAGIVAGRLGGVAREAEVYAVKVMSTGGAPIYAVLAGMAWACRNNMDVVSISLGGDTGTRYISTFANAVQALMSKGCVVVAGTGDDTSQVQCPANTPGIVAVGKYGKSETVVPESNWGGYGNQVTVVAPGEKILTTFTRDKHYVVFDGSSATAPHVAGLIALIKERLPRISSLQIISQLILTASTVKETSKYWDIRSGAGLIDCESALADIEPFHSLNQSLSTMEDVKQPPQRTRELPPKGYPTATLEITVKVDKPDPKASRYFFVMVASIDAPFAKAARIELGNDPATFDRVPLGRYSVLVVQEGKPDYSPPVEGKTVYSPPVVVYVDEPMQIFRKTIYFDRLDPIGKITAIVLVNGARTKGKDVTVDSLGATAWSETKPTDINGEAKFTPPDGQKYRVTAKCPPHQPKEKIIDLTKGGEFEPDFWFP